MIDMGNALDKKIDTYEDEKNKPIDNNHTKKFNEDIDFDNSYSTDNYYQYFSLLPKETSIEEVYYPESDNNINFTKNERTKIVNICNEFKAKFYFDLDYSFYGVIKQMLIQTDKRIRFLFKKFDIKSYISICKDDDDYFYVELIFQKGYSYRECYFKFDQLSELLKFLRKFI
jgi:hypothetical protein